MWARTIELMLGVWLIVSPFVFRGTLDAESYAVNDMVCGFAVVVIALVCFWQPLRRAHLATLAIAAWLALWGYFSAERPGPPAAQNDIIVGLLLLIFAIVPSDATEPPQPWREPSR